MSAIDLTKEPPRSPRVRIRGYAILARAIDKCRAELVCRAGEYHYDCPLDRLLFSFKGISSGELRRAIVCGETDEEIGLWLDARGTAKTPREIKAWSDALERYSLYNNPAKREFFVEECQRLGLDPRTATMFDWLEADDAISYRKRQPAP